MKKLLLINKNNPAEVKEKRLFGWRFMRKAYRSLKKGIHGVGQEADETKEMAQSFFKMLEHKLNLNERDDPPSKEEVKAAIEQLKDVGRFSLFATVSILPGGGISLIGLELLARKFGIRNFTFIPSSFRKKNR
ncbi:hypothetical protein ACFLSY_09065 [Bacteroidota bacterium]